MGTEIGRDLADINRYNKLPVIIIFLTVIYIIIL